MSQKLLIRDQSTSGRNVHEWTLEILTETLTIREIIRARIYQEVQDHNRRGTDMTHALVQPAVAETALNDKSSRKPREINWKDQFTKACQAFESSQILILVDDHQAESLEEQVQLKAQTVITFLKLLPLVGG